MAAWWTSGLNLGLMWVTGMLAYAATFYRSEVKGQSGHPTFMAWITRLDVLSTKVVGLAVAGLWIHSWKSPTLEWLDNVMPHRPFAAFVFGFFCDVLALRLRQAIQRKQDLA